MVIDFHVHGKITSNFPFEEEHFLYSIEEAKEYGLDSIAITEHCDSNNFLEGYNFLESNYQLIKDYYDVDGFRVFYGMEVTTKQNLDFLIIGKSELILELRKKILNALKGDQYIEINDLFRLDILDELLIILAHPYRDHTKFPKLENYVIEKINGVELNSRDIYNYGIEMMKAKVIKLAEKLKLPVTGGSDAHYFIQISTAKNILNRDCDTVKEIKEELKNKNYNVEFSEDLKVRVKSATIIKRLICNEL